MKFYNTYKFRKYFSDIFINHSKALALLFHPPVLILVGSITFAIAESIHCKAHIYQAWNKEQRSKTWRVIKIALITLRLMASLAGAVTLSLSATLLTTVAVAPIFPIAFFIASCASTLHKLKGVYNKPTAQLMGRALIGVAGTTLTGLIVLFKAAALMALMTNPVGIAVIATMMSGMMVYKAVKAYQFYKTFPKETTSSQASLSSTTTHLLRHSPPGSGIAYDPQDNLNKEQSNNPPNPITPVQVPTLSPSCGS